MSCSLMLVLLFRNGMSVRLNMHTETHVPHTRMFQVCSQHAATLNSILVAPTRLIPS